MQSSLFKVSRSSFGTRLMAISHHITWQLGIRFPRSVPLVYVIGYPKSGTTWVSQLVADYLQLPFPRFSLLPIGFPAVVHGHELVSRRYPYCVYVMRDGRDALVSKYFNAARKVPEGDYPKVPRRQRRMLGPIKNKVHVKDNIAAWVRNQLTLDDFNSRPWQVHVRSYFEADNTHIAVVCYEDLLNDGPGTLAKAMAKMTGEQPDLERARLSVEKFTFRRQAGRDRNVEDRSSFLRKGIVGDWGNYFTREAAEIFDHYAGGMLIEAGYEQDHSWVDKVTD